MKCFIDYPQLCDFPIENLPYGVFSTPSNANKRIGVAIGDKILDLNFISHLFDGPELSDKQYVFQQPTLNAFMGLNSPAWKEARVKIQNLLSSEDSILLEDEELRLTSFVSQSEATMHLPASIGDYTDCLSSFYHAENCSILMGRDSIFPNWKYLPLAYHGRASSVVVSGTPITRPQGQSLPLNSTVPVFRPCNKMDFELELGFFIGGPPTKLVEPVEINKAQEHIFGCVLLNDWSARDIQLWESAPLGPFTSKNFATSISPWVVTTLALEPFIVANVPQNPVPFPYLRQRDDFNFDIKLQVDLFTKNCEIPTTVCKTNYRYQYWTVKQQLVQHTISGCNVNPGDLIASGTISGATPDSLACLFELSWGGTKKLNLVDGSKRTYLEDGDTVYLKGVCEGKNFNIGFGDCVGTILPCINNDCTQ